MIKKLTTTNFFNDWEEIMLYSCLDGTMGEIYGNEESVVAYLGDFVFLAGKPSLELVKFKPTGFNKNFVIMVPRSEDWNDLIELNFKFNKTERYAIKKETDIFDEKKLQTIVDYLDETYELKMIDEEIYSICNETSWLKDLVAQYGNYDIYKNLGLGCVILKDGQIVSGASSYSSYKEGIEIEIDTHIDHRRKGLALVCGAKLILECLKRNLYPSWDAQNKGSVALAEKLGYHFDHAYPVYEIFDY